MKTKITIHGLVHFFVCLMLPYCCVDFALKPKKPAKENEIDEMEAWLGSSVSKFLCFNYIFVTFTFLSFPPTHHHISCMISLLVFILIHISVAHNLPFIIQYKCS